MCPTVPLEQYLMQAAIGIACGAIAGLLIGLKRPDLVWATFNYLSKRPWIALVLIILLLAHRIFRSYFAIKYGICIP